MQTASHFLTQRIYLEDTDAGGIVYHANYLKFAERGRTEFLRHYGFEHARLLAEQGIAFVVRRLEIDYLRPARLDDVITVTTHITHLGGARMKLQQIIGDSNDTVRIFATIQVEIACTDSSGCAIRLPKNLVESLTKGA